jgi:hypothetical protein
MAGMHARQHMMLLHAMQHHHHVADATHNMAGTMAWFYSFSFALNTYSPPHASSITPTPL